MNWVEPAILFFLFGMVAGLLRSELRLPAAIYDLVSMLLLISIGLKGGIELAEHPFHELAPKAAAVLAMGVLLTLLAYTVLRYVGRFKRADAASIAAHYGSVSVGTFAVASAYFSGKGIPVESYMPFLLAVLEVPAILVGIFLARGWTREIRIGTLAREVLLGKGIVLLTGGLLIGWAAGPDGVASIKPLFFDLFKGILALFLLEMGLITAAQIGGVTHRGFFLLAFGIGMPILSAVVGTALGFWLGLSVGGTAMLATLAASASYIAVPAAMRISVPEANPSMSLAAALGISFPFNVLFGIPLYHMFSIRFHGLIGG